MMRKLITLVVLTLFSFSSMGLAFANTAPDLAVMDKVVLVEKFFAGSEQTGALVERVSKLERDIFGKESTGSLVSRADKLYTYCRTNSENAPSFLLRMNAAEWSLTHMVTAQPVKVRLENLEHVLMGNVATGCFEDRLNQLLKLGYASGKVAAKNITLNKDSLVKIKLVTPLSTKTTRSGDLVTYQVVDDITVDGTVVIAKGAQGTGKVLKVEESKNFGRDAQLQISFDNVEGLDGSVIPTFMGEKAKEENKSLATAAGASVAGMVLLGPIGIVGGAFVHGKNVEIPAGTELFIQIKDQVNVYGI